MPTSVNDLKRRLLDLLSADQNGQQDFQTWFAFALRDSNKSADPELRNILHLVESVFADAAEGTYSVAQVREILGSIANGPGAVIQTGKSPAILGAQVAFSSVVWSSAVVMSPESQGLLGVRVQEVKIPEPELVTSNPNFGVAAMTELKVA